MSVVPKDSLGKIQFYEDHTAPWNTNAVAIGTTVAAVTGLTTKTTAARAAYVAHQAAQETAKAATETYAQAVLAMATAGSAIIDQIRAQAKNVGPSVYPLAQIPAPAGPSPVGPPGAVTDFEVELSVDGSLTLTWKCANPVGAQGTMYQVWRRIGGTGDFTYCGGCGTKKFVDQTVPAGSSQVTYQVQAVRSTAIGPWAQFNVNFGTTTQPTVTQGTPVNIAA